MTETYAGATSQSRFIELVDSTTGLPKTGVVYTDVTGSYVRTRSARTAITMATLASPSAGFSPGGFIEVDATNMPGIYRVDVPDAAFATGAQDVVFTIKATGCRTVSRGFELIRWNKQVGGLNGTVPTALKSIDDNYSAASGLASLSLAFFVEDDVAANNLIGLINAHANGTLLATLETDLAAVAVDVAAANNILGLIEFDENSRVKATLAGVDSTSEDATVAAFISMTESYGGDIAELKAAGGSGGNRVTKLIDRRTK